MAVMMPGQPGFVDIRVNTIGIGIFVDDIVDIEVGMLIAPLTREWIAMHQGKAQTMLSTIMMTVMFRAAPRVGAGGTR